MNDKISKQKMYTEFSIRLDKLEYKLDKLLGLMETKESNLTETIEHWKQLHRPPQWPNESYSEYMKRIGELNTAQSDEEVFREECK